LTNLTLAIAAHHARDSRPTRQRRDGHRIDLDAARPARGDGHGGQDAARGRTVRHLLVVAWFGDEIPGLVLKRGRLAAR
jgi:hypothetical protein